MNDRTTTIAAALGIAALIGVVILGVIGWVLNIITLCGMDFSHVTGEMVVRVVGIFIAVIGAVYGWF